MLRKTLALLLILTLALGATLSLAEATPAETAAAAPADDPVLATVGDEAIRKSEVDALMPQLANYMSEESDYAYAVNFLVQQKLLNRKIIEQGLDQFDADTETTFAAEAQKQWDDGVESYVSYYLSEDTEEARSELRDQAAAFYAEQGFSIESLTANIRHRAAFDRMTAELVGDYVPTEEEIQATFQQFGAAYQTEYENNVGAYEYNTLFNQQPSWYTPAGYRGIIHILLQPDAALLDNYARLLAAFEEQSSDKDSEGVEPQESADPSAEPAATAEPVTQEMVNAARQAILDSKKAEIDSINARLAAGESFEALIAELGQDPGMQSPENLQNGYKVHKESIAWDPAFTAAAFSDKMQKVGDVSDPIVGTNGIHILKYQSDVPSGLIMTDAIRQEISDYLKATKENEAYQAAFETWKQEVPVVLDEAAIQAATDAARAAAVPQEEAPLQAVPETSEAPAEEAVETTTP